MRRKGMVLIAAGLIFAPAVLSAEDYRAEIMEKMIDPCYWTKVKNSKLTEYLGPRKAVEFMKPSTASK